VELCPVQPQGAKFGVSCADTTAAIRFAFIRFWRAFTRAAARSMATASPLPKDISSGVGPLKAASGMVSL
jgi:hypothetical protein